MENLKDYFENIEGRGVLATADKEGRVDVAIYARPHFIDDNTIAFIMADKLSHSNVQENPKVAYLFMENKEEYVGRRLFLTKIRESEDQDFIKTLSKHKSACSNCQSFDEKKLFLVYFKIDSVLPLVGAENK